MMRKRCTREGCARLPSFGRQGSGKREFCSEHRTAGMVDVKNIQCGHQGCSKSPSFGKEGSGKREFCSEHKMSGMVNIMRGRCTMEGCAKVPSYGRQGSGKREFCSKHKMVDMVDVNHKRCRHQGCRKQPSFGKEGSGKRELCSEHKTTGMVSMVRTRCIKEGCARLPSFGKEGSGKRDLCSKHKMVDMVDVRHKRCRHQGCPKQPSFGKERGGKTEFCSEHKTTGMVNVLGKRCTGEGCAKLAVYGLDGSKRKQVLCSRHFTKGNEVSSVETQNATADTNGMKEKPGEQFVVPISRKRAVRDNRFPRQVEKTSGKFDCGLPRAKRMRDIAREERDPSQAPQKISTPVQQSSSIRSTTGITPTASHDDYHHCPETQNLCRDDRATSQARRQPVGSGCGRDSTRDLASHSCLAAATPPGRMPPDGVVLTSTEGRELTGSTRTTGSAGVVLGDGGGDGDAFITSRPAGAGSHVSAISSLECGHSSSSCVFALEHRHKIASLENSENEAEIEVSAFVRKIASLEQENREVAVEALRDELGAASRRLKDSEDAYAAVCEERRVLRQQVASAATKFKAQADKRKKAEEGFQQRIEVLRAALNGASTGWEKTKDELKEICQERDVLHNEATKTLPQVSCGASKFQAEATQTGEAQKAFKQHIEALRAELTAASKGWEETKGELKQTRQERDALQKEVTKTQAQVASAASKVKTVAAQTENSQEALQLRIDELRTELTAAWKIWEETKGELKQIRQERDELHKELEKQEAFNADMGLKAAAMSKAFGHRVESIRGGPSTDVQPQAGEMESTIAPGPQIPASLPQTMMAGSATVASPAAFAAACAVAQSSGGSPSSDIPTPPADRAPKSLVDSVIEEGQVDANIRVCELKHERAAEVAALPQGCLDISTVAIKPEG